MDFSKQVGGCRQEQEGLERVGGKADRNLREHEGSHVAVSDVGTLRM